MLLDWLSSLHVVTKGPGLVTSRRALVDVDIFRLTLTFNGLGLPHISKMQKVLATTHRTPFYQSTGNPCPPERVVLDVISAFTAAIQKSLLLGL